MDSSRLDLAPKDSEISSKSNLKIHTRMPYAASPIQVPDDSIDPKSTKRKQILFGQKQYRMENVEMLKPIQNFINTCIKCAHHRYKVHEPLRQFSAIQNLIKFKFSIRDKANTTSKFKISLIHFPKLRTIPLISSGLDTSYQDFRKDPLELEAKRLREMSLLSMTLCPTQIL